MTTPKEKRHKNKMVLKIDNHNKVFKINQKLVNQNII